MQTVGMVYADICAGISAATIAWKPLGWSAAWYAENAPFPSAVLKHHYPQTPNYGDMTRYKEWPDATLDVLIAGTPCQGFSIAGDRKGLDDDRSKLALQFVRIAERYKPRWIVLENVPGIRSSEDGRDLGAILRSLGELGYGLAWRSLDAQYAGLAQRRERVFVVGYLGDWRRAAAVLFDPESLRWAPAPSREKTSQPAPTLPGRTRSGGGLGTDFDLDCLIAYGGGRTRRPVEVATPLSAHGGPHSRIDFETETFVVTPDMRLRRITPTEAERLMGVPEGYTAIPWRGKVAPDGPRYKALGNSIAVPELTWIGERIALCDSIRV